MSVKLFFIAAVLVSSLQIQAQQLPSKKELLTTMRLTNQYFMDKWPDAGKTIITNKERPSSIWTRGVYYEGLMALHSIETQKKKKKEYVDYAMQWGQKHKWSMNGGIKTRNADNHCAGQTYYDLYVLHKRKTPYMLDSIKASIDLMLAGDKIDDWSWIDALQMAMPVFVYLGNEFKNPAYHNRMYEMYAYTKYKHGTNGLYNPEDKLWWRDKDFDPPYTEPNGEDCYWSRGNGWIVAALVRTLDALPKTDAHYQEYLQDFKDLCEATAKVQRPDGLWNVSLHDPNHYGGKEITGTALFIYGYAYGINKGILDRNTYLPLITKAWNAIVTDAVHANGFLGYVQGTGKEPKDGQPVTYTSKPDFEDYGLGCLLLAGSEIYKMKR